ncbi:MAG: hypothetical protein HY706_00385, partial [Candidatus Hydrogenedentes bacterium]|nr:hypothetical protein [Candidatus Hydrogenedentota bacterium]
SPVRTDLRTRIVELCADLFESIGLQTSVAAPYLASGSERGAVLDFVDHPLDNRWWFEDEFARIRALTTESEKVSELERLRNWENPGPGGFYDDLGNPLRQPHVVQQKAWNEDPGRVESTQCEYSWNRWRQRLSWQDQAQTLYGTPLRLRYDGLNLSASYRLSVVYTGRFQPTMRLTANGSYEIHGPLAQPNPPQVLSYNLPAFVTSGGTLELAWELFGGRGSQVAEVWLTRY